MPGTHKQIFDKAAVTINIVFFYIYIVMLNVVGMIRVPYTGLF